MPLSKVARIGVIVAIVAIIVGGYFGYQQYQMGLQERMRKETLVVGLLQNIQCLDPANTLLSDDANVYAQIYEGLLEYDPVTKGLRGALAEKYEISSDGKSITFYIRKNVKFHDGTPLNASAVKFSLERVAKGPAKDYVAMIDKIIVLDDYTLRINLKMPFPPLLSLFAGMPKASLFIVSQTAVQKYGEDFKYHPVGTGPFKFVEWIRDDRVVLEANENYWREPPKIKRLIMKIFSNPATAKLALEKGEIDLIWDGLGCIPPTDLNAYASNPNLSVIRVGKSTITFFFFWLPSGPTANKDFRKALAYAINYDAIIKDILGGWVSRALSFCPEGTLGYEPVMQKYQYNLTKAKEYIEKSGIPTPVKLVAGYYSAAPVRRDILTLMKQDFAKIGVEIEIKAYELAEWMETYKTGANNIQISAWTAKYADPHGFFVFFANASIPYPNNAHYCDPEYEALLKAGLETIDPVKRAEIYKRCQEKLAEDLPAIPLYSPVAVWIVPKNIVGILQPYPFEHAYLYGVYKSG
jgi:peptide/nickel transport system substrate-binding protein